MTIILTFPAWGRGSRRKVLTIDISKAVGHMEIKFSQNKGMVSPSTCSNFVVNVINSSVITRSSVVKSSNFKNFE